MSLLKDSWTPNVKMKRIIVHWTGGSYNVTSLDKKHYHFIIDGQSKVHKGDNSIKQNHSSASGPYAAHTYGLNADSIGVSVACMGGRGVSKQNPGPYPLKKAQWETAARLVAELCTVYDLNPIETQVLQHGDVHRVYGIDQWGKWDINFLPWNPTLGHKEVGDEFRRLVRNYMEGSEHSRDRIEVLIDDVLIDYGQVINGQTMIPARKVVEALGHKVSWDGKERKVNIKK